MFLKEDCFGWLLVAVSPKVLIIYGSPRKYGVSSQLAELAVEGIMDAGGTPERLYLYDYNLKPCIGCVSDGVHYCKFPCVIRDDDFNYIANRVLESDGLIVSTSVYWYAPTGVLKNLLDRFTSLENMIFHKGRSLLEGKVAGFIVAGLDSGVFMTVAYLMSVLNSMGAIIPPWSMAYTHIEDITKDEGALKDAYNVGYLVVETIKAIKAYRRPIAYKPDVETRKLMEIIHRFRGHSLADREARLKLLGSLFDKSY